LIYEIEKELDIVTPLRTRVGEYCNNITKKIKISDEDVELYRHWAYNTVRYLTENNGKTTAKVDIAS